MYLFEHINTKYASIEVTDPFQKDSDCPHQDISSSSVSYIWDSTTPKYDRQIKEELKFMGIAQKRLYRKRVEITTKSANEGMKRKKYHPTTSWIK